MHEADEREELLVLTQGWDDAVRAAFVRVYDCLRTENLSHEEALMRALQELLP
jgi:hypothetical protein